MALVNPFSDAALIRALAALTQRVSAVETQLTLLVAQGKTSMINTDALTAEIARNTSVEQSALTLIQGMAAQQKALSQQLADAIASGDPAKLAAAQKALDDSTAALTANDDALAAAVAANTVAA
jgi:hypothetical protein